MAGRWLRAAGLSRPPWVGGRDTGQVIGVPGFGSPVRELLLPLVPGRLLRVRVAVAWLRAAPMVTASIS